MLSNYTILHVNTKLEQKKWKNAKKVKQTRIPLEGMVDRLERAYLKGIFPFISRNLKYQQIKIDALWSLLYGIQRLTTSL